MNLWRAQIKTYISTVMKKRKDYKIIKTHLPQDADRPLVEFSEEERFLMVWQITMDVWSFLGDKNVKSRLQRHTAKLIRP